MSHLSNKVILLTGGTGTFGQAFTKIVLNEDIKALRIYSRGEYLQNEMAQSFRDERLKYFIGDVRDRERLSRAMNGADIVVHAAAMKQVPACEYNPMEAVATNINGALNVVNTALENHVAQVMAISSDKAVHPVNMYGATKAVMERLVIQANVFGTKKEYWFQHCNDVAMAADKERQPLFACVRYGNVIGSRGSVIPLFEKQKAAGFITITDLAMTRFWITIENGVHFVLSCLAAMRGGEIFIPRMPSMRIVDLANIIAPGAAIRVTGIRPGEKLHEVLVTEDEARHCRIHEDYFTIAPEFPFWTKDTYIDQTGAAPKAGFRYSSDNNTLWLTPEQLKRMVYGNNEA
ncbi:MAG: UDP-N-acetylglucosamine 4,6-dehydratase (inverting) [Dehalococcoidia bacterium]|nr:UDP-N-acetylglucosamine 4,6-dehydratase (inverting) [Dehalococcoidia bacterium]